MSLVTAKREEAGLSMAEVARRINWVHTKLWKIEHGERRLLAEEVPVLARAIGCDPSDLLPSLAEPLTPTPAEVSHGE